MMMTTTTAAIRYRSFEFVSLCSVAEGEAATVPVGDAKGDGEGEAATVPVGDAKGDGEGEGVEVSVGVGVANRASPKQTRRQSLVPT